jgi:glycosyltransferase involved in cell wall biosynthesis
MSVPLSIITINFNNALGLIKTIESVIDQEFEDYEYIIIDGGSIDGSIDCIIDNIEWVDYWVSESDSGIYDAMNKGIFKAKGDYLMFLNSGDTLVNSKVLTECLNIIKNTKSVDILYGDILTCNHPNPNYKIHKHPKDLSLSFFINDTINHQASLIKADLFREIGFYEIGFKLAADYYFFLKCFVNNKTFKHANLNMVDYDFSGQSAVNEFKIYKAEQKIIWELLIPKFAKQLIQEREILLTKIRKMEFDSSYKIVRAGVKINIFFQKIRSVLHNI